MILGILFFSIIIGAGFFMLINGASNRFHWPEVKGSIVGFNEYFSWSSPHLDEGPSQVFYIPIVQYVVKNKEYSGQPKYNLAWNETDFTKEVIVLYDPKKPEDFHMKDNTMFAGCILVALGVVAILIILFLNL